jgi:hypothetical protein
MVSHCSATGSGDSESESETLDFQLSASPAGAKDVTSSSSYYYLLPVMGSPYTRVVYKHDGVYVDRNDHSNYRVVATRNLREGTLLLMEHCLRVRRS